MGPQVQRIPSAMESQRGTPYGEQIAVRAKSDPDGLAVVVIHVDDSETALTWQMLEDKSNQWARLLSARGVTAGSMVALAVPNSPSLVLATIASWKVGAIPVPMRWDLPDWERQRLLEVVNPVLELTVESVEQMTSDAARYSDESVDIVVSPAINGICSSGSTGLPKVILNTAPALWTEDLSVPFIEQWCPVPRPQIILVPAPMYHTNGFVTLNYLLGGDRLVILEKFTAATMVGAIERHQVTTFTATPTMLSRVADLPEIEKHDLSTIAWILQGAAAMPSALLRYWFTLLSPEQIVMAYGMTENLGLTALRGDEWLQHPGSVGRAFRDTEIRVMSLDNTPAAVGEIGEIYMRAPMTNSYRYLGGAPPLPTTSDGFTSAGDLGHMDEEGYLYIADRRTDMIVTGGANVFPAEVEAALLDHEDIVDVAVIGLADPDWGRRVHAVVQPRAGAAPTAESVIQFARDRLAGYKVPKSVEFVAEIPRTAATKLNRSAMIRAREGLHGPN